jgi:hypothetical protein
MFPTLTSKRVDDLASTQPYPHALPSLVEQGRRHIRVSALVCLREIQTSRVHLDRLASVSASALLARVVKADGSEVHRLGPPRLSSLDPRRPLARSGIRYFTFSHADVFG